MYVSIGSRSNVSSGEPPERAAIVEFNPDGTGKRIFAGGLRNPVGMAWEPVDRRALDRRQRARRPRRRARARLRHRRPARRVLRLALRVPRPERRPAPRRRASRSRQENDPAVGSDPVPLRAARHRVLQRHDVSAAVPRRAFVALHGSWNRAKRTGYKVISIPLRDGKPTGGYDDFVAGWMPSETSARSGAVRSACSCSRDGSLLISDDGGGKIWRVTFKK